MDKGTIINPRLTVFKKQESGTMTKVLFLRVKVMAFLMDKVPDLFLNIVIVLSGFWAGLMITPLEQLAPVLTFLVAAGFQLLRYLDDQKSKRKQQSFEERLAATEAEKKELREKLEKFEAERGQFRSEVRSAVAEISAKVEAKENE
jgi:hypothetical protein